MLVLKVLLYSKIKVLCSVALEPGSDFHKSLLQQDVFHVPGLDIIAIEE